MNRSPTELVARECISNATVDKTQPPPNGKIETFKAFNIKEAMETNNTNNSLFETLNPNDFAFHRHRRRPLKSQTYHTFIRLLSICRDASFSSNISQDDSGSGPAGQIHDMCPEKSGNSLTDQVFVDNGRNQVGDLSHMQVEVGRFDDTNILREGNGEFSRAEDNVNSSDSVVDENKADDKVVETVNDHNDKESKARDQVVEIVNDKSDGNFSLDFCDNEGYSPIRDQVKADDEIRVREVCESIEFALCMDPVPGLSQSGEDCVKKGDIEDSNVTEEMQQELQQREMELEKLISDTAHMDSSQCVAADDKTEEGEISGEDGVYDKSVDMLFEDVMLLKEKEAEEVQDCADISDKDKVDCVNGSNVVGKCNTSTSLMLIEKDKESSRGNQARRYDDVATGKDLETRKAKIYDSFLFQTGEKMKPVGQAHQSDHSETGWEHPTPPGKVSSRSVTRTQSFATTGQDASASQNKRKRGPATKEKKAKKKRKERIKRAEKNRKLGVKRLKLQPVAKPKTVTYCRHYLKGRCQEGEKCKFSHDTVPLTKSKPCCHFARSSCMKGDDCPFDHQLSKYPCDNYLTKGFCTRGAGCLFSHKMPANDGSSTTSTVLESGSKTLSMLSDSKKLDTAHQNDVTKYFSSGMPVGMNTEHNVARSVQKHTAHVPKGINIFLHEKSSPSENGKQKQAGQPSTSDDIKLGLEKVQSGTDNSEKVNKVSERASMRTPKGINFLSFGKASSYNSNGKAVSSLLPHGDFGVQLSTLGDLSISKEIPSSSIRDDSVKVSNLCGQIPVASEYPSAVPRSCSHSDEGNSALTRSNEGNVAPIRFQHSCGVPHSSVSSALPDKSAAENSKGICSSSKNSFLLNTPSSVQRGLQSTLSFAAKFESEIKLNSFSSSQSLGNDSTEKKGSCENKSVKGLTVLDFLYGNSSKTKT